MTEQEIIKYIDDGAVFYLDFFGGADHMETTDNGIYRRMNTGIRDLHGLFALPLSGKLLQTAQRSSLRGHFIR